MKKMNDKKNIIVMFLFIMLSFAIISEVSAASAAEINGTGSNPSLDYINMMHDIAGERNNDVQGHADDFKSHNEQKSFDEAPRDFGDKNYGNENLYEHDGDKFNEKPMAFNDSNLMNHNPDGAKPMDNNSMDIPKFENDFNSSFDLRDNDFRAAHDNGEVMGDVMSKFGDFEKMSPDFKRDDLNKSSKFDDPKQFDKNNVSVPQGPGKNNMSDMRPGDIKNNNVGKMDKKPINNVKVNKNVKTNSKAVKNVKVNKNSKFNAKPVNNVKANKSFKSNSKAVKNVKLNKNFKFNAKPVNNVKANKSFKSNSKAINTNNKSPNLSKNMTKIFSKNIKMGMAKL